MLNNSTPQRKKTKKILLIIVLLLVLAIGTGTIAFFAYPKIISNLPYSSWERDSFEEYTCDLLKSDCEKLENYRKSGWRVKKFKNGDPEFPNEVIGLFKDFSSLDVHFEVVASKEEKKIISRLPEPIIFEKILQEAQKDTIFTTLIKTNPSIDTKIIDHLEFLTEKDCFEFVAEFSAGKDSYGVGCTKSYYIEFSEKGEILNRGETKPYCPGPL